MNRIKENELSNLLEEYKKTVDLISIVSKTDSLGKITYVNKQFEEISGYTKEELLGKPHNIIRHPDMPSSVFKELWETIKIQKKPWYGIVKNKKKNGEAYYVNTIVNPIIDTNGNIIEFIAIRTDITELEERKEYLKTQYNITSKRFKDVFRLSKYYEKAMDKSSIVLRISKDLKINYVNDNFCELTQYSLEELINQPYSKVLHPNTSFEEIQKTFANAEKFGVFKKQLKGFTKTGEELHFLTTILPIKDRTNSTIEYMAVRNDITEITQLHKELEETQREIIYKIGEIGETRSLETGNHVKRVAEYSKLLALKAGLSEEESELIKLASPLHDIGKVAIADSILNKPGKLTAQEFEKMKEHSEIGYNLLKDSSRDLLKSSAIIAHQHHEKWDGTGYPRGLKGKEIHFYGRITAICDVFDALSNERPYKKAWELKEILQFFENQKGKHFEPVLVNIFLNNLDEFLKIKNKY